MSMTCRETAGKDVTFFLLRPPSSHQMLLDHDHVINSSLSGRNIFSIRWRSLFQNWGVRRLRRSPQIRYCYFDGAGYITFGTPPPPHGELSPFVG
jgi:hypothetical protein